MKQPSYKVILEHPDRDELISKLIIGISTKDIHEFLASKYTNVGESKFIISEKLLKSFKDNYLDIYKMIQDDLSKTKSALTLNTSDDLQLAVRNNPTYKDTLLKIANNELDIKTMLVNMIMAIETRAAQVFDNIQEDPRNINSRNDRVLIEWLDLLGSNLERFNKVVLGVPDQVVQHNVTVQHIDQYTAVFCDAIKRTLSQLDIETSLYFMEVFNEEISKVKMPVEAKITPTEERLADVKILHEDINKKLNGPGDSNGK